jgi:hypothetical protein
MPKLSEKSVPETFKEPVTKTEIPKTYITKIISKKS